MEDLHITASPPLWKSYTRHEEDYRIYADIRYPITHFIRTCITSYSLSDWVSSISDNVWDGILTQSSTILHDMVIHAKRYSARDMIAKSNHHDIPTVYGFVKLLAIHYKDRISIRGHALNKTFDHLLLHTHDVHIIRLLIEIMYDKVSILTYVRVYKHMSFDYVKTHPDTTSDYSDPTILAFRDVRRSMCIANTDEIIRMVTMSAIGKHKILVQFLIDTFAGDATYEEWTVTHSNNAHSLSDAFMHILFYTLYHEPDLIDPVLCILLDNRYIPIDLDITDQIRTMIESYTERHPDIYAFAPKILRTLRSLASPKLCSRIEGEIMKLHIVYVNDDTEEEEDDEEKEEEEKDEEAEEEDYITLLKAFSAPTKGAL